MGFFLFNVVSDFMVNFVMDFWLHTENPSSQNVEELLLHPQIPEP